VLRIAPAGCRVEEAENADRRIDAEARGRGAGARPFALQRVVGEDGGSSQIVEEMPDAVARRVGNDALIPCRDGLQQNDVEEAVELEEIAVQRLDRIVRLFIGLNGCLVRRIGACGAGRKRDHERDAGRACREIRCPGQ